jgi:hypothetical protein
MGKLCPGWIEGHDFHQQGSIEGQWTAVAASVEQQQQQPQYDDTPVCTGTTSRTPQAPAPIAPTASPEPAEPLPIPARTHPRRQRQVAKDLTHALGAHSVGRSPPPTVSAVLAQQLPVRGLAEVVVVPVAALSLPRSPSLSMCAVIVIVIVIVIATVLPFVIHSTDTNPR